MDIENAETLLTSFQTMKTDPESTWLAARIDVKNHTLVTTTT